jgi:hypothetical protein
MCPYTVQFQSICHPYVTVTHLMILFYFVTLAEGLQNFIRLDPVNHKIAIYLGVCDTQTFHQVGNL